MYAVSIRSIVGSCPLVAIFGQVVVSVTLVIFDASCRVNI